MQQDTKPARLVAQREDNANEGDQDDLKEDHQPRNTRKRKEKKRTDKDQKHARDADAEEPEVSLENRPRIFGEAFPELRKRAIHSCSLQAQDYPNYEIILLDDQSSDRTAAIAFELGFTHAEGKCRIISGQPLPSGWVGKPWACQQISQAARGEYLLFTDADTHHAPHALTSVIAEAIDSKSDLLTLWPAQETKTWSEKLVIPILFVAAAGMLPHWLLVLAQRNPAIRQRLSDKQWRMLGAANGQYILFTRKAYDEIGGHAAVKNHMVEDVALGRLVASQTRAGMILRNCDAGAVVST